MKTIILSLALLANIASAQTKKAQPPKFMAKPSTAAIGALSMMGGSEGTGGGDLCEDRIKIVRDDIKSWILKGGSKDLTLSSRVSGQAYAGAMLAQIDKARVSCVGPGDEGYPVRVNGTPKTCKFTLGSAVSRIICDGNKFQAIAESDQYVLVHHEFAGLAGIETPNSDDSDYSVSNQISGFLVDQVVKKLVVRTSVVPTSVPKGFVFLSSGSAPVRLHFDDHYYVYRCLSYTGKLEQESDCSDYGPGQYLSMNRVEPLEPGIYLLKKDPTARDYFFTVKSGQKTDIPISLVTIGQLLKLHKNLKHYLPLSTNYDIKVIVDYRSPTQRLSEELLARAAIKNRLAGKFETRCGQNIGVADALQRGEFEICVGQTRKTLRLLADKEAQRILSMYEMNPAEGFYIHDYLPTGEIRRNKLDFNWVDIDGRNATSLESIAGGLFKGIAGEGAGYEYIYKLEEHDVTQVALVPGDYVILVTNNSKETVDSFPLKVTGKK